MPGIREVEIRCRADTVVDVDVIALLAVVVRLRVFMTLKLLVSLIDDDRMYVAEGNAVIGRQRE